jgi:threonine synthase
MTHSSIPLFTYVLDAMGIFGVIVGGYVASRSVYSKENSRDASQLIDTQRKRIDSLVETVAELTTGNKELTGTVNKLSGELKAYKQMSLVSPDIIVKLSTTLDSILEALSKDGVHVGTQLVDTQVIGKQK